MYAALGSANYVNPLLCSHPGNHHAILAGEVSDNGNDDCGKEQAMTVRSKEDIFAVLEKHTQAIKSYGVHQYGLFGSFVRNEQEHDSDIDILVEFVPNQKTFDNFIHLAFFLEEILGRKVDLITKESLSPYIGPRILQEVEYVSINS